MATLVAPVYNLQGTKLRDEPLDARVFGVRVPASLLSRAVMVQRRNSRTVLAHTKTRGERRGGGRKPWKQKGTGRARQGSTRSPQWRKGGVVFGPRKERVFSAKLNRKERQRAILGALSLAATRKAGILVLESLQAKSIKTKPFAQLFTKLPVQRKTLVVIPARDAKVELSMRNLPKVKTQLATNLNVMDLLAHRHIVLPVASLKLVAATYAGGSK